MQNTLSKLRRPINGPVTIFVTLLTLYIGTTRICRKVDPAKYTYNSGQMIQAGVLLYQVTGEKHYLKEAQQTAEGACRFFLKVQPIATGEMKFFRELLGLM